MLEFMSEARPGGRIERAELSLYDAMVAELYAEKENRMRKFMQTHGKDKKPSDRKRDHKNRMRKMYGLTAFEDTKHGKTVFYWERKGGQKKFPEYEAEIFRNLKTRSAEKYARKDYETELFDEEMYAEIGRRIVEIEAEIKSNSAQLARLYEAKEAQEIFPGEYWEECEDLLLQGDKLVAEFDSLNEWLKWA